VVFALVGLGIVMQPFDTIDDMGRLAFGGLAVLFPVTLVTLRWGGVPPFFSILSILVGELLLISFYYEVILTDWLFGFDSFIIVLTVCFVIIAVGKLIEAVGSK
jgi:hypothetical protein